MAKNVAAKVSYEIYDAKIKDVTKELNMEMDRLFKKYIPAPVIACVNEYERYFGGCRSCNVSAHSGNGNHPSIFGALSFSIPHQSSYLYVDEEEYKSLQKINKKKLDLFALREKFHDDIYYSLLNCRTINVVKKELPELLPYFDIPEEKSLPSPIFGDLRKMLKTLNQDKNGKV